MSCSWLSWTSCIISCCRRKTLSVILGIEVLLFWAGSSLAERSDRQGIPAACLDDLPQHSCVSGLGESFSSTIHTWLGKGPPYCCQLFSSAPYLCLLFCLVSQPWLTLLQYIIPIMPRKSLGKLLAFVQQVSLFLLRICAHQAVSHHGLAGRGEEAASL